MAKIIFQTEGWGGVDGRHHIEFGVNGRSIMVTVTDDHIHVIDSATFKEVDARSCNSFHALPKGSRFKTLQEYHEWVDRGSPAQSEEV